ncbi:FAD-dependent monooxygenase andE [Colletotrichum spaethianum]|uniref:FAD-dependent monooxygenase andE n=1 Tax=Colletotrichum spaethianum TaxID=700344 RepID=A0AA37NUW1_9PEZI|nr:FAD-dependent monooxygenase andE [Colletotrichum spaethianum]GKT42532.1 FAD-dependent monooxygenase andE [Colletotrichum spaethianum]
MDTQEAKRQVIIVGGGITGLTLALMLQNLGINYVLLEAYGTVTPNVGASIGLFPNGLRILDQLGCYEDILSKAQQVEEMVFRNSASGKRITTRRTGDLFIQRHGYPSIFMERYQLLNVLYDHLKEKKRIFVNKKVRRVESLEDSALVHIADGLVFEGQIVVGADGVRSTIRQEMWRNADDNNDSAAVPARDRGTVPCEHACIFGTAKPTSGITAGEVIGASGDGTLAGCMGGPGGEVFVFWFWTLPKSQRSCSINSIPRFDEEDKQRQFKRSADALVADNGLRFSKIVDSLEHSGVTALPHFVMRRWHYGRIIIIGDAAHKFNPLVGQGGNSCIESCAALINALQEQNLPSSGSWKLTEVTKAFVAVEDQRVDRLVDMVEKCQEAMRASAWDTWKGRLVNKYISPLMPMSRWFNFYSGLISGGLSLKGFSSPTPVHDWPYSDEKSVEDKNSTLSKASVVAALPVAALTAFLLARVLQQQNLLGDSLLPRIMEKVSKYRR